MKFISLFAGIGGFDLALERLGHECVYANDFDKYCKIIYDKHFSIPLDNRSIRDVSSDEIPDHDILVGGFPCQAFSIAGRRAGFEDTRGTLFFEVARILRDKRPGYFILENVKGLLSHDGGKTFSTILEVLSDLGYIFTWRVHNSKNHGVPQNRERIYIVGYLGEGAGSEILSSGRNLNEDKKNDQSRDPKLIYWFNSKTKWIKDSRGIVPTLKTHTDYVRSPHIEVIGELNDKKWSKFNESSRRVYSQDGVSPTVPTSAGGGHIPKIKTSRIRRLTPVECERLQGFPDGWTEGVSDTQRYKMCGNAVTVNVVFDVASSFFREKSVKS